MKQLNKKVDLKIYPDAGHAFEIRTTRTVTAKPTRLTHGGAPQISLPRR